MTAPQAHRAGACPRRFSKGARRSSTPGASGKGIRPVNPFRPSPAAVLKLVDEGKVELDAPVTAYLPDFTMADGHYTDITVRMLLNHSSGLPGSTIANGFLLNDPDTLAADTLLEELSSQTLKA